jgi:hypothetical protein
VNKIHDELAGIDITRFQNAAAVLFRVFFELSVDTYCDVHGVRKTKFVRGDREMDLSLREKFEAVCADIETKGGREAVHTLKPVKFAMKSSEVLLGNIEHMHQFVHGAHMVPTPDVLRATADQAMPFLLAVWPQPGKR